MLAAIAFCSQVVTQGEILRAKLSGVIAFKSDFECLALGVFIQRANIGNVLVSVVGHCQIAVVAIADALQPEGCQVKYVSGLEVFDQVRMGTLFVEVAVRHRGVDERVPVDIGGVAGDRIDARAAVVAILCVAERIGIPSLTDEDVVAIAAKDEVPLCGTRDGVVIDCAGVAVIGAMGGS